MLGFLINQQDYELLRMLCKKLNTLHSNLVDYEIQKFYYEGIFLDLTDCRQAHPRFEVRQNQVSMKAIFKPIKNLLVADIVWEVSKSFDLNLYLEKKWFVDFENEELETMTMFKQNYLDGKITFLEYHLERVKVYLSIQEKNYVQIYKDMNGYIGYRNKIKSLYSKYN